MSPEHPTLEPIRLRGLRRLRMAELTLALCAGALAGCGEPPPLPELPATGTQWFWRDVLAAPLADEARPRQELLGLAEPAARVDGIAELLERHDPASLSTLLAALKDPDTGVATVAAEALGDLGDGAAIPRLLKGVGPYPVDHDVSIHVRVAQASALARLGNPAGMPLLLMILAEDTDDEVARGDLQWEPTQQLVFLRELALPGLLALAGTDFGYVPNGSAPDRLAAYRRARDWWEPHRLRLWADSPASGPGLELRLRLMVAHLGAYQLRQIDGARYTLSHVGPAVLPFLRDGLDSDDPYVRVHVLEIMRMLADKADSKGHTRLAIIAAGPLLDDPEVVVATAAAEVCAAAGVADPLVTALARRAEPELRLAVVDALGASGRPVARTVLEEFALSHAAELEHAPDLAAALEGALLAVSPERSPDALLAMLAADDPDQAYAALERLIRLTGGDQGVRADVPANQRGPALEVARRALSQRTVGSH